MHCHENLDPTSDMVIDKVNLLIETNVKSMLDPACKDLSYRIDIIEALLRDICESEEEAGVDVGGIGPMEHFTSPWQKLGCGIPPRIFSR